MSPTAQLQAFAQSVYLVIRNRYYDDITSSDGQNYINQVIDWTNQYLDELENVIDPNGEVVNWNWTRQMGYNLGTANGGTNLVSIPNTIDEVLTDEKRYVQISVGGKIVSNWAVVSPSQLNNNSKEPTDNRCAVVGNNLVFSRSFNDTENGGSVLADVETSLPRMSTTNVKILSIVKPKQLLILGVAKNSTLPDIVQGGLSPSYVQKYNDLLQGAIARNNSSTQADTIDRDNFSNIHGVGF